MPVPILGLLAGVAQTAIGVSAADRAQTKANNLAMSRQAYKMPSEIMDIYNMSLNNAQTGYDPTTLSYMTSQAQGSLAGGLNTATKLGADPNDLSSILDKNFQNIFQIGSNNDLLKMKKFDSLINATQLVAQNKDAQQISADNLIKDQLQTQAQRVQAAQTNTQSGANLALNSAAALANFYKNQTKDPKTPAVPALGGGSPGGFPE